MSNHIARAPMDGKVNSQALHDERTEGDRILVYEAGQLRIEIVNLCTPEQNLRLLDDLATCAGPAEEISVLTHWKEWLGEPGPVCEHCAELEQAAQELLRALEAYQISPGPQVSAWVRMAERDLREALEA